MRKTLERTGTWAFAVMVAAGLSFGARSALAEASSGSSCTIGACSHPRDCEDKCYLDGMWIDGFCAEDGCCYCPS